LPAAAGSSSNSASPSAAGTRSEELKPTAVAGSQATGTASLVIGVRTATSRLTSTLLLVSATRTWAEPKSMGR
jgi:hypothetical protein